MKYREYFDFTCECGVYVCTECDRPFYPMELDNEKIVFGCPECGGDTRLATEGELILAGQTELCRERAEQLTQEIKANRKQ